MQGSNKYALIPALRDSIFSSVSGTLLELAELGIDDILESEALKQIPIASLLISISKLGYNLHERHLLRELVRFINSFNRGEISKEELDNHKKLLDNDPVQMEKELSRIIIILSKNLEEQQSIYLGKFYRAYINKKIDWNKFVEFSRIISEMFDSDFTTIRNFKNTTSCKNIEYQRLVYLSLISEEIIIANGEIKRIADGYADSYYQQEQSECGYHYQVTELGHEFLLLSK